MVVGIDLGVMQKLKTCVVITWDALTTMNSSWYEKGPRGVYVCVLVGTRGIFVNPSSTVGFWTPDHEN